MLLQLAIERAPQTQVLPLPLELLVVPLEVTSRIGPLEMALRDLFMLLGLLKNLALQNPLGGMVQLLLK